MGVGTISAQRFFVERPTLTPQTSDPAATVEGELWLRGDIAPETDQIGTLRLDAGSGSVVDIPVWAASATTADDQSKQFRVAVGGQQGFVATQASGAAYPQLGVWDSGTRYGAHDALDVIPDSGDVQALPNAVGQYIIGDFSDPTAGETVTTAWPDGSGNGNNLPVNGSPQFADNGPGDTLTVSFDPSNDDYFGSFPISNADYMTIFAVVDAVSAGSPIGSVNNSNLVSLGYDLYRGTWEFNHNATVKGTSTTDKTLISGKHSAASSSNTEQILREDRTTEGTNTNNDTRNNDLLEIGREPNASLFFDGNISYVEFVTADLSESDMNSHEQEIVDAFGLSI